MCTNALQVLKDLEIKAKGIFPPRSDAILSEDWKKNRTQKDLNILRIHMDGRDVWEYAAGYSKRNLVENAMFRFKNNIGPKLGARTSKRQEAEIKLGVHILNQMTRLGMSDSVRIREKARKMGDPIPEYLCATTLQFVRSIMFKFILIFILSSMSFLLQAREIVYLASGERGSASSKFVDLLDETWRGKYPEENITWSSKVCPQIQDRVDALINRSADFAIIPLRSLTEHIDILPENKNDGSLKSEPVKENSMIQKGLINVARNLELKIKETPELASIKDVRIVLLLWEMYLLPLSTESRLIQPKSYLFLNKGLLSRSLKKRSNLKYSSIDMNNLDSQMRALVNTTLLFEVSGSIQINLKNIPSFLKIISLSSEEMEDFIEKHPFFFQKSLKYKNKRINTLGFQWALMAHKSVSIERVKKILGLVDGPFQIFKRSALFPRLNKNEIEGFDLNILHLGVNEYFGSE